MAATFTLGTQFEVDTNGGLARVATLTSSTAIALYSSAAAGIEARHLTNSGGTIAGGAVLTIDANQADSVTICRLSNTSAVIGYAYGATHVTRVLTVAGTTLTANTVKNMTDTGVDYLSCEFLDTNKIIYVYSDSVNDGQSRILSITGGTTVNEGSNFTFEATDTVIHCVVGVLDTSTAIVAWGDSGSDPFAEVLDISGTTITGNTHIATSTVNIATTGHSSLDLSVSLSDSNYIYVSHRSTGNAIYRQRLLNTGGTLTRGLGSTGTIVLDGAAGEVANCVSLATYKKSDGADPGFDLTVFAMNETDNNVLFLFEIDFWFGEVGTDTSISTTNTSEMHTRLFPGTTTGIVVWNDSTEAITITIPGTGLDLASMTKPADVDAAGEFIYLALLEGGTPILTKISTALDADGTTVFSPGAGDNIGVECGRFNSDVVWVAGQFDGTNVVEKSEDGGSSFSVADDATIGGVKSFVMGPDNDNRILVFDEDNGDILETNDGGQTWTSINTSVTPEINSIARLGKNVQESVFGNDGGVSNSINYSVNSGDDLEDFQTGVYPNANATKVIVN
jgi:adhesin HecA-like repeat protein